MVGPTQHGLAATTMLVDRDAVRARAHVRHAAQAHAGAEAIALTLMVARPLATQRKTALIVPVAVVLYLATYRPASGAEVRAGRAGGAGRAVHFASPGSLGTVFTPTAGRQRLDEPPRDATSKTSRPT